MMERLIGETIFEGANAAGGTALYGPWFPRGGDAAVFTLEVINI